MAGAAAELDQGVAVVVGFCRVSFWAKYWEAAAAGVAEDLAAEAVAVAAVEDLAVLAAAIPAAAERRVVGSERSINDARDQQNHG